MLRKLDVVITEEGRDKGKRFQIEEMTARQGEEWALKLLFALGRTDIELPEGALDGTQAAMATLARVGLRGIMRLPWSDAKPLLDEMMACVSIKPDPRRNDLVRPIDDEDIEEVATRLKLRMEVFTLHTGFSMAGNQSTETSTVTPATASSHTQTSPSQSRPPYRAERPRSRN